jgi:hypothetical protein
MDDDTSKYLLGWCRLADNRGKSPADLTGLEALGDADCGGTRRDTGLGVTWGTYTNNILTLCACIRVLI